MTNCQLLIASLLVAKIGDTSGAEGAGSTPARHLNAFSSNRTSDKYSDRLFPSKAFEPLSSIALLQLLLFFPVGGEDGSYFHPNQKFIQGERLDGIRRPAAMEA